MAYKCGALTLEDDGYCTRCATKHGPADFVVGTVAKTTPRRRPTPKIEIKPEPVVFPKFELKFKKYDTPTPQPEVANTPASLKKVVRTTMRRLFKKYGLPEMEVKFSRGRGAKHLIRKDPFTGETIKEWFVFGVPALENIYEYGLGDYATVARRIGYERWSAKGERGLKQLVYHEFAHLLQCAIPGGRTSGSVHNSVFISQYKRVMNDEGYDWR